MLRISRHDSSLEELITFKKGLEISIGFIFVWPTNNFKTKFVRVFVATSATLIRLLTLNLFQEISSNSRFGAPRIKLQRLSSLSLWQFRHSRFFKLYIFPKFSPVTFGNPLAMRFSSSIFEARWNIPFSEISKQSRK